MKNLRALPGALTVTVALLLGLASWGVQRTIAADARRHVAESLVTVRDTAHHSVHAWVRDHESTARVGAKSPAVVDSARQLLTLPPEPAALLGSPAQQAVRNWFAPIGEAMGYDGFFIVSPDGTHLASTRDENTGVECHFADKADFLPRILAGGTAATVPMASRVPLRDRSGDLREGVPTMFVGAPIIDDAGDIIAAFAFRLRPSSGFAEILAQGQIGSTGETYAFDGDGRLISRSRFDEQLHAAGLLAPGDEAMLHLLLRDPGANLVRGERSPEPLDRRPLTRMAGAAVSGQAGVDVDGYRDYRGVPVVGAWLWDADLGLGIATEMDVADAYQALRATTWTIVALTALIVLLVLALTVLFVVYRDRAATAAALRERETLLGSLVDAVGTDYLMFRHDFDGVTRFATPAIKRFTGVPAEKAIGRRWWDLFPVTPDELARIRRIDETAREGRTPAPFEATYSHPDGTRRTVEVMVHPDLDDSGEPMGVLGIVKDMTERHRTVQELRRAATVFENSDEGIIVADVDRRIIAVNKAFTRITGFNEEEALGRNPRLNASGRHDAAFYSEIWRALETRGEWRGEIWNRRKNGEIYPAWENITVVRDERGQVVNYVALFSDITSIKQAEERLSYLAHHDPLTGLPNRLRFTANLEQALAAAKRHRQQVALMFLDLDGFKPVNDALGHAWGDELLKVVAARIQECVRGEDTAARMGGDEFTVILSEINRPEDAALVAEDVIDAVQAPIELGYESVSITASVGISIFPDDGDSADTLVSAADDAMYLAKRAGPGQFRFHRQGAPSAA